MEDWTTPSIENVLNILCSHVNNHDTDICSIFVQLIDCNNSVCSWEKETSFYKIDVKNGFKVKLFELDREAASMCSVQKK